MEISYLNEQVALVNAAGTKTDAGDNLDTLISAVARVTNEKRSVDLLKKMPLSFGSEFLDPGETKIDLIDLGVVSAKNGKLRKALERWFPEIKYLDFETAQGRDINHNRTNKAPEITSDALFNTEIDLNGNYYILRRSAIDDLTANTRQLLLLAAYCNGVESALSPLKQLDEFRGASLINTGLRVTSTTNRLPLLLGNKKLHASIVEHAKDIGCITIGDQIVASDRSAVMVFPKGINENTLCQHVFTAFINSLIYAKHNDDASGNSFVVEYKNDSFQIQERAIQLEGYYRRIVELAANSEIALCAHCGTPILTNASRGKTIRFCGDSCRAMHHKLPTL